MTSTTAALLEFFLIGVATPLTAACVLPLYPAFIAYLGSMGKRDRTTPVAVLGVLVVAGVVTFMGLIGLIWTALLGEQINQAVETVSPVAFALLVVVGGVLLVAPGGFGKLPSVEPPHTSRPKLSAFGYGFFFGAIIIPCNPGLIALFFSRTTVVFPAFDSQIEVLLAFLSFGIGIGAPLLAFALLSQPFSEEVTRTLARHSNGINRFVGLVLVVVSAYYLLFVFRVVPGL
ncbi:MAG: cytochrome c biogenesis protein CcdA [Natronomonas sp.]